jgi:hypothetical protein
MCLNLGKNIEIFTSFDAESRKFHRQGEKDILYQTVDRLDFIEIGILI